MLYTKYILYLLADLGHEPVHADQHVPARARQERVLQAHWPRGQSGVCGSLRTSLLVRLRWLHEGASAGRKG